MKFSYNWIRELVPDLDIAPQELMRLITMKTAECEGVEQVGAAIAQASAARVISVEPLDGGHNRKVIVETELYGAKIVVCGAPNCRAGILTVYLPVGKALIHGVESDGMLASGQELGINRDHTGIVELDGGFDLQPDSIIEVDNKSLTHRPDLWGHYGMAREVAAIAHRTLRDPVKLELLPDGSAPVAVDIADLALCPRYSALVFENVTVQPSPLWLQYRLEAIGLNPINNIVDVTNYVMAELAQPMHAFDAGKLHGATIFIRTARTGEKIVALNEESYDLTPTNLVIADSQGPIAIAGVIGGLHSAIGPDTKRIIFESANFQAASVRKTSSRLKLRTDASMRFEKAQDPVNTVRGLARAVELLQQVSPGIRLTGGLADRAAGFPARPPIELSVDWVAGKLGRGITSEEVRSILESLEFGVMESVPGLFRVSVPSWRATKDISIKDDLLEEVGRIIGYDSITPAAPLVKATVPPDNPERAYHRYARQLVAAQGFTEVRNYSFIGEDLARAFGFEPADHLIVSNPIASDQALMRASLLPGIWKNILENSKHLGSFRFFEIGREIHKSAQGPAAAPHPGEELPITRRRDSVVREFLQSAQGPAAGPQPGEELPIARRRGSVVREFLETAQGPADPQPGEELPIAPRRDSVVREFLETALAGGLPDEVPHLAAVVYAREGDGGAGLFELKRLAECLMPQCEVNSAAARPFEHPERAAEVSWQRQPIGRLFELHPSLGVEGRAAILDLDLRLMQKLDRKVARYRPLRRFPTSSFDLSVITGLREPVGGIRKQLAAAAGADLVEIEFIRQYSGDPLPAGRKSVSYRLTVGAPDRTLSSDEAGAIRTRIIEAMRIAGYELRV